MAINNLDTRQNQNYNRNYSQPVHPPNNGPIHAIGVENYKLQDEIMRMSADPELNIYGGGNMMFNPMADFEQGLNNLNQGYRSPRNAHLDEMAIVVDEEDNCDIIFSTDSGIKFEQEYPDYKQYVFSTIQQGVIEAMRPNNMVMPVRFAPSLQSRFHNRLDTKKHGSESSGVYIVEYFSTRTLSPGQSYMRQFEYYFNDAVVLNNNSYLKNKLHKLGEEFSKRTTRYSPISYVRIITFIPNNVITSNRAVFVRHAGLVIGRGLREYCLHPFSREASYLTSKDIREAKNYIDIDIIDNSTNNKYYVKTGNKVIELDSSRDINKTEGVSFKIVQNGDVIQNEYCNLNEAPEKLGVYNSKEDADFNGDYIKARELEIKNKELETKINNAETALQKSTNELNKAYVEIDKLKLEQDNIMWESEASRIKHKYNLEKINHERRNIELSMDADELRYEVDKAKAVESIVKSLLELRILSSKAKLEAIKHEYEVKQVEKNKDVGLLTFGVKIINLIGGIL